MTTWLKRAVLLLALCFVAFAAALPDDDDAASPQWPACIRGSHRAVVRSSEADFSWWLPIAAEPGTPFTSPALTLIGVVADQSSLPKTEISLPLRIGRAPPKSSLI